ncbi:MAG: CvpA family protein [Butyrivibrio sp.]|nr:CvpA family protein [Butyrivibrio sp.]
MIATLNVPQLIMITAALIIIIWRVSYGYQNGIMEEAAGIIALIAALTALYIAMNISQDITNHSFSSIAGKIVYFVIAVIVYKLGHTIGKALKPVKYIPLIGQVDKLAGGLLGFVEAYILILIVQKIFGIEIIGLIISIIAELYTIIRKYITTL